jgi:hypothetical protein
MRTRRKLVFLVVPGCYTANVPEYIGIASVLEGVTSIKSDMSMVSVKVEWVDKGVADEIAELAGQGAGAMAVDAIDWSAVTACPPAAVPAEWTDAWGAVVGEDVRWPAVGLLLTNSRKVSAATVLERRSTS